MCMKVNIPIHPFVNTCNVRKRKEKDIKSRSQLVWDLQNQSDYTWVTRNSGDVESVKGSVIKAGLAMGSYEYRK